MGMTKVKKIKLGDTDWLELFVTKLGKTYCVQFTNKVINVMEVMDKETYECKSLMGTSLSPQSK